MFLSLSLPRLGGPQEPGEAELPASDGTSQHDLHHLIKGQLISPVCEVHPSVMWYSVYTIYDNPQVTATIDTRETLDFSWWLYGNYAAFLYQ